MQVKVMAGRTPIEGSNNVITLPCMCANLRRAARVVTQIYEDELRPSGIRMSQFTLLQSLSYASGISQKKLARLLEFDSTTLTRTLAGLRRKGWLRAEEGTDRRELRLSLSAAGQKEYKRVLPYWQAAQTRLRRELGETKWNELGSAAVHAAGTGLVRED
jgi:DNA-binding MarR family transcriptional regulator